MATYDGPISLPSGVTAPIIRGSPLVPTATTTVTTPLRGAVLPALGTAFLKEAPFIPTEAGEGLRYPIRRPVFVRKVLTIAGFETLECMAGENLSGHRIVAVDGGQVFYASRDNLATLEGILGMTLGAASIGDTVNVRTGGEITEPSWTWISGQDIFLGINGQLTQTVPPETEGTYFLRVGVAIDPTTIFLDLEDPILF